MGLTIRLHIASKAAKQDINNNNKSVDQGKVILDYEIILIMCGCLSSASKEELLVQLDEFSVIRQAKLAEGAYGEVWKCRASGDCIYALKEIRLQNSELSLMYQKEARILVKCNTFRPSYVIALPCAPFDSSKPK